MSLSASPSLARTTPVPTLDSRRVTRSSVNEFTRLHTLSLALPDGSLTDVEEIHYLDLRCDAPFVRHLTVELPGSAGYEAFGRFVAGSEQLKTLEMRLVSRTELDDAIPWLTLRSLTMRANDLVTGVRRFLYGLQDACQVVESRERGHPTLPLRHLALDLPLAVPGATEDEFDESNVAELLGVLGDSAFADLDELDLRYFNNPLHSVEMTVPSVRILRLHNITLERDPNAREGQNPNPLVTLYHFLAIFDNLERLELDPRTPGACWSAAVGSSLLCALRNPEFFALLHILESTTKVTEVRLRASWAARELRWTREDGERDWQCELYTFDEA